MPGVKFGDPRLPERFWAKVRDTGDCWVWTAAEHLGYGRFNLNGEIENAHRLAYRVLVSSEIDGLHVDHQCHNLAASRGECEGGECVHRRCVNPAHLEAVQHKVNILRGMSPAARHARKMQCPAGHPYDRASGGGRYCSTCAAEANRRSRARRQESMRVRVPDDVVDRARQLMASGVSRRRAADILGIKPSIMQSIQKGKSPVYELIPASDYLAHLGSEC